MPATVIIPARYASARFPGKPLAPLLGRPMIQHVYERAMESSRAAQVWVATDDPRIVEAVRGFGGNVVLTGTQHASGTHRVVEAAQLVEGDPVVNLQGDEPLILPGQIDQVIQALEEDPEADVVTLRVASRDAKAAWDPNCVKVVVDHEQRALYFSRAPIPYYRGGSPAKDPGGEGVPSWGPAWIHIGLYGFSRRFLLAVSQLPPSPWEEAEQLEQLRFLYWGYKVLVLETPHATIGVDVPEDLSRVERILAERNLVAGSAGKAAFFREQGTPTGEIP